MTPETKDAFERMFAEVSNVNKNLLKLCRRLDRLPFEYARCDDVPYEVYKELRTVYSLAADAHFHAYNALKAMCDKVEETRQDG